MKRLVLCAILMISVSVTVWAQDILNLRMDRDQLGLRGNVATIDEDLLVRKDYFREDWPTRKGFRKDLRQILQEDAGHIYTFHPNGRLASVVYTYRGQAGRKTSCSYASNGLLSSFTGEGYRVEAKYSGSNATVNIFAETPSYSPKVDLDHADLKSTPFTTVYPYDMTCRQELSTDGFVLKSSYYYVDSMPARVCTYTYSHLNQVLKERVVNYTVEQDGSDVTVTNNTYDGNGFLVMKRVRGLAVDETYTYFNNEMGDCTELTIVRPYGTVVYTYEYEYDQEGNWTMRLCYKDGVFDNAVLRHITYSAATAKPAQVRVESADDATRKMYSRSEQEKAAKAFKSEKASKTEKAEKVEKAEKAAKAKSSKAEKAEKAKSSKAEKTAKAKSSKAEKAPRAKSSKAEKAEKAKSSKAEKAEKAKAENSVKVKDQKNEKSSKPAKAKIKKDKKTKTAKEHKEKQAKADKKAKQKSQEANKSLKGKASKDVKRGDHSKKNHTATKSNAKKEMKAKADKKAAARESRTEQTKVDKKAAARESRTEQTKVDKKQAQASQSANKSVQDKVEKTAQPNVEKKVKEKGKQGSSGALR